MWTTVFNPINDNPEKSRAHKTVP